MISQAEREQLLFGFNDTAADYPSDKTIVDLFSEQAQKTPDSIAVVFGDEQLTYRQLDARSNQLGHLLRSNGIREDSLVAICLERSLEMIIGILGILKAGGAYVPIDPDYPLERIAYMLEDTAAKIALTAGDVQLPVTDDLVVVNINAQAALIDAQSTRKPKTKLTPENLAYVIYTSGSTGLPKGVMIEHKGLFNYGALAILIILVLRPGYRVLFTFASFTFDGSCQTNFLYPIKWQVLLFVISTPKYYQLNYWNLPYYKYQNMLKTLRLYKRLTPSYQFNNYLHKSFQELIERHLQIVI